MVELYIDRRDRDENKRIFDRLLRDRREIEESFGKPLDWQRLDDKRACRICYSIRPGGYRRPEAEWPALWELMVDEMQALEKALLPRVEALEG